MPITFRSICPAALVLICLLLPGCSIQKFALNKVADTFAETGDVFASDEDPELVRDALPFALKTMETLLAKTPDNRGLLLATCRSFASYSVAFVATQAEQLANTDFERSKWLEERALKLDLRAKGYCLRALELTYPGIGEKLLSDPDAAVANARMEDVALLYWAGASWGTAIGLGLDRPELVVDLPAARALITRALELDPSYEEGVLHDAMITIEALPAAMGGSIERAREHYEKAVELSGGHRAGPHITWATAVSVKQQNRAEFETMLEKVLAIDPDAAPKHRLVNIIAQRRARLLKRRVDELFFSGDEKTATDDNSP